MKSIKCFKYKDSPKFEKFLNEYNYKLDDVKGYKSIGQKQYCGNVLKLYFITLELLYQPDNFMQLKLNFDW